jgi:hypothetical protein
MEKLYIWLPQALLAILELLLMIAAGVVILRSSKKHPHFHATLTPLERAFARLARRRDLSVLLVGFFVLVTRLALNPILGTPQPGWHDEFSYLLAGDTFAHARFTNPTHPMWIHFESFHIIEQPTYMSMYPPAQGLVLAAGQVLGRPWIGQLFITALMCSTLCWMLQAWLPPFWALFGAILVALRLGILSYWMNTYWCASVAALGGALVLGAWPRLREGLHIRDGLLLALGLAILANSRPYEGFVLSIAVAFAMFVWLVGGKHPPFGQSIPRAVVPIFITLIITAAATGYYNFRVTGSPFRMAYEVNRDTYSMAPYFIWQSPRPELAYRHAVMRDFYFTELREFERNRTFIGYVQRAAEKFVSWWQFFLGPLLTVPLFAFPWVLKQRKMRLPLLICAAMVAAFAIQTWTLPHYFAPATGALYILLVQCVRFLWHWAPGARAIGRSIVRAIPVLACAMILLRVGAVAAHVSIEPHWPRGNLQRANILREMEEQPGQQLVIVRYGPQHNPVSEWVYNRADIDGAKVVWARDMGRDANKELLQYFRSHKVWLIEADRPAPEIVPYPD